MLKLRKKEKKTNKYEKVSPEGFIKLAEKNPSKASKKMRERYELSDAAHSHAVAVYSDTNLKGWYELANLLSERDPVLAKSILMPLLRIRNFKAEKDTPESLMPDMRLVAQQLYNLEDMVPEIKEEAKLAVLYTLLNCGFPDQPFWESSLEKVLELASKHTKPEKEGYMAMIAATAFYAEDIPSYREKTLNEVSQRLKDSHFLENETKPSWSKGYFFKRMSDFCIRENDITRNSSFKTNPNSSLYLLLNEVFGQWVEQYIQSKSYNALVLLQHAIHACDEELSSKASEAYKKHFYEIAVENPQKASECLYEIASYSCCYFTGGVGTEERHQNFNLYNVFDETIPVLMKLDKNLGIRPFFAFIKSHGNVPLRMRQKYKDEINTALTIQIQNRSS